MLESIEEFLAGHAPEMEGLGQHIMRNSARGNQLGYALREAAIGSAARQAGHDAIIGYSRRRDGKGTPFFSEVFDVRERLYPNKQGNYGLWDSDLFGSLPTVP